MAIQIGTINVIDNSRNVSAGVITGTTLRDTDGNLRAIPENAKAAGYALTVGDIGKYIDSTAGGITINTGVFSAGDAVSIYNNSGTATTVTPSNGVLLRLAGTATTGPRYIAQRGLITVLCVTSNEFVSIGAGLT